LDNRNITLDAGLEGLYRLVVRDARTDEIRRDTGWFKNLILDSGLNRLGTGTAVGYMQIGTGSTAPNVSDVALATWSASTSDLQTGFPATANSGSPLYISSKTWKYRFNAGSLNGNYTEVGIGWASTGNLFSRALILDGGGSPTTISIGPTEYLDVYYVVRNVPDLTDKTTSVVIGGVTYSCIRRPGQVNAYWSPSIDVVAKWGLYTGFVNNFTAYTGTLGPITGTPSGTSSTPYGAAAQNAYASNSYECTGIISVGLNDLNVAGGIKSLLIYSQYCCYQYQFDIPIPKDATKVMTLSGKMTWARLP